MESEGNKTPQQAELATAVPEVKDVAPSTVSPAPKKDTSIKYKDDEETRFLLGRKLDYASTLANVCMTWWVSSLVFCGSIFAAVWIAKDDLITAKLLAPLGIFIALFFAGLAFFGGQITWGYLRKLRDDLSSLPKKVDEENFLSTELSTFRWSMTTGTVSFIFIFIAWNVFWTQLVWKWW